MKAITIIQPWATLIAIGEKRFETRSWATKYRGPLAIHAGKKIDREVCASEPFRTVLAKHGYTADNLPTGAVVAMVTLLNCWEVDITFRGEVRLIFGNVMRSDMVNGNERDFGWYERGRFAWELDEIKLLELPIPAKGQQRLWNWEGGSQ